MPRHKRRAQLLESARSLLESGGLGALTMESLARQAGVSKPVVYEHFSNSESVAIAILEDFYETIIDLVDLRTRDAQSLDEYLSIAIDTQFEFQAMGYRAVRCITNGHSSSERLNTVYLEQRLGARETFAALVRQQGASNSVAHVAGYALAEMVSSAVFEFGADADSQTAKETVKRMLVGAVAAIIPAGKTKPRTPEHILEAARKLRDSRSM